MPYKDKEVERDRKAARRLGLIERGVCTKCKVEKARTGHTMCASCAESAMIKAREQRRSQREAVLDHYGRSCSCCGEDEVLFLELDHIGNDGNADRRKNGIDGLYARVIRAGFPDTFQVLCSNCNRGKHRNGGVCPHKTR